MKQRGSMFINLTKVNYVYKVYKMDNKIFYGLLFIAFFIGGYFLSPYIVNRIKSNQIIPETGCLVLTEQEARAMGNIKASDFPCLRIICDETTPLQECLELMGIKING